MSERRGMKEGQVGKEERKRLKGREEKEKE